MHNKTAEMRPDLTKSNSTTEDSPHADVEAEPVDLTDRKILIPIVVTTIIVVVLVIILAIVLIRMKRSGQDGRHKKPRSPSIDDQKVNKVEDLKTISNISTSSVDEDEQSISLQHWTSKKAVSNRYESWHIGEINNEWVRSELAVLCITFLQSSEIFWE
jgi:hypothetical protein